MEAIQWRNFGHMTSVRGLSMDRTRWIFMNVMRPAPSLSLTKTADLNQDDWSDFKYDDAHDHIYLPLTLTMEAQSIEDLQGQCCRSSCRWWWHPTRQTEICSPHIRTVIDSLTTLSLLLTNLLTWRILAAVVEIHKYCFVVSFTFGVHMRACRLPQHENVISIVMSMGFIYCLVHFQFVLGNVTVFECKIYFPNLEKNGEWLKLFLLWTIDLVKK